MTSPQSRSKAYGYQVEVAALESLKRIFPGLRRVGSMGYSKAHADLVQNELTELHTLNLVVTRDKGQKLLVTMSADDLAFLAIRWFGGVRVQVKGRAQTWIGRLYRELVRG